MKKLSLALILSGMVWGISPAFSQNFGIPTIPTPQPATMPRYDVGTTAPAPNGNTQVKADAASYMLPSNRPQQSDAVSQYEMDLQRAAQEQREYDAILADVYEAFGKHANNFALPSHANDPGAGYYQQAYKELNAMLAGVTPLSLKRAVFLVENAYYENRMNYQAYEQRLQDFARFCRLRLKQEHADTTDNGILNNMIYRFLTETLTVTDPATGKKIKNIPIHYDFEDPRGKNDHSKVFVTKLMATGYGQCHSMPILYNMIAAELGAKSYLSASPSHSFIKYPSGNGFKNVELTNGYMTTDAFVLGGGFIKAEALKNHLYLDTINAWQQIACLMQDLAIGYIRKYGYDEFVNKCNATSMHYYPNNAVGLAVRANYCTAAFRYAAEQIGPKPLEEILRNPDAKRLYDTRQKSYDNLDGSGYAEIHEEEYEDWLKSINEQKRKQEYELFLRYQKTHKTTLSNGSR